MRYVLVGFGVASIAATEAIRSIDQTGEVVMVGDDPHGFYSRPGLAYFLTGELHDKALYPRTANDFKRLNFQTVRGRVTRILRDQKQIEIEGKPALSYDRLLLAVGSQAMPIKIPGTDLAGVFKLDHMEDAKRILSQTRRGKTAVVIGGGITALELVEAFVARGMNVHYLLRGDRYWSGVLDEQESKVIEQRLVEEGVKLHFRTEVAEVTGQRGRVNGVKLKSGKLLKCDMIAYAVGIRPRVELAKESGLAVDRGILVNEYMQTDDPNIYAAGDVAQAYDPATGTSILDSLWAPARQQGFSAGLNMAGQPTAYVKSAPLNVTRLAGLTTTIIGMVGTGKDDDLVGIARGDSETWRYLPEAIVAQSGFDVNHLRLLVGEKNILGAIVMGDQKLSFPLERIISSKMDISPIREKLLSPEARIGDVIADFWSER